MSDLVSQLLDGAAPTPTRTRKPIISESDLKEKIRQGAGSPLSFTEDETPVLAKLVAMVESDPFRSGPEFNKDDLDGLGLNVKDGEDSVEEIDGGGPSRTPTSTEELPDGLINIDQAVMAPNATPGHDEPIPDSVLHAMDAIAGVMGGEQPVPETMYGEEEPSTIGDEQGQIPAGDDEIDPDIESAAARLVGGDALGESLSIPSSGSGSEPGLDPTSLAETMRRMRGQSRAEAEPLNEDGPRKKAMSLTEIASANRRTAQGETASTDLVAQTAQKVAML